MALIPDPSSRSACRLSLFPLFPFPVPHLISPPLLCTGGPAQLTRHPLRPGCATPHFTCALFYMKLEAQQDLLPGLPLRFLGKDEETGSSALSSTRTLTKIYVLSNLTKRCSWKVHYTLASLSVPLSHEHELQLSGSKKKSKDIHLPSVVSESRHFSDTLPCERSHFPHISPSSSLNRCDIDATL